jgi:hypothetical protein
VIKLKETEGSSTVQITINDQTHKKKGSNKYIFDIKGHQFIFLKPENETIYKFYIDSTCLDDLLPNNKKQKKSILDNPKMDYKTMLIKPTKNIDNIHVKNKPKNVNDLLQSGSDIYKKKEEEENKEVEKEEKEEKKVGESEDYIPEYDYLCQKIINADPF